MILKIFPSLKVILMEVFTTHVNINLQYKLFVKLLKGITPGILSKD